MVIIESVATITIIIEAADENKTISATIISNSGETILQHNLHPGKNYLNITPYLQKNYAIRIVHGKNVTVKKI